jgi:hypothetical protein
VTTWVIYCASCKGTIGLLRPGSPGGTFSCGHCTTGAVLLDPCPSPQNMRWSRRLVLSSIPIGFGSAWLFGANGWSFSITLVLLLLAATAAVIADARRLR